MVAICFCIKRFYWKFTNLFFFVFYNNPFRKDLIKKEPNFLTVKSLWRLYSIFCSSYDLTGVEHEYIFPFWFYKIHTKSNLSLWFAWIYLICQTINYKGGPARQKDVFITLLFLRKICYFNGVSYIINSNDGTWGSNPNQL